MRTDRHDEANSRFSQFYKSAPKRDNMLELGTNAPCFNVRNVLSVYPVYVTPQSTDNLLVFGATAPSGPGPPHSRGF
jgi:hypothetical protein